MHAAGLILPASLSRLPESQQLEVLHQSHLLLPQSQHPLNFSLNRYSCDIKVLLLAARYTRAVMLCSSIIPGQYKHFQQMDYLNRRKVKHESHTDNDLSKNFY